MAPRGELNIWLGLALKQETLVDEVIDSLVKLDGCSLLLKRHYLEIIKEAVCNVQCFISESKTPV